MNLTDKDIAELLDSVSESLAKSAKKGLKKDAMPEEMPEAPAPEQAPMDAPAPEAAPAPEQAPAPEVAPEAAPEQALEGEADAPLSDVELQQVYSSMDPEELERHFSVIKDVLTAVHGQGGAEEGEMPAEEAAEGEAPEMAAPEAAAPQAPEVNQAPDEDEDAFKSEAFINLKKENDEIKKSLFSLTKVIETMAKPVRKSVSTLAKSETPVGPMSKSEMIAELNTITRSPNLSKSDRQSINNYLLSGVDQDKVEAIINSGRK